MKSRPVSDASATPMSQFASRGLLKAPVVNTRVTCRATSAIMPIALQ